jgi:formylmethanofuran dehydrogenase subunit C
MTALTFTLKNATDFKINCSHLTPNLLKGLTLSQIQGLTLANGHNAPKVADFFEVNGNDTENIIFSNSTSQLDYIGYKMKNGSITIQGDTGDFLGCQMQNGTIICQGSAGDRVGDQMRRGVILIDGNAGNYCASRIIAGTIGIYGQVGKFLGFAMKRGTLLVTQQPTLHATIQDCGSHTLPFLALLFQSFKSYPTKFNTVNNLRVRRFAGDLACNGSGEVLVISP